MIANAIGAVEDGTHHGTVDGQQPTRMICWMAAPLHNRPAPPYDTEQMARQHNRTTGPARWSLYEDGTAQGHDVWERTALYGV